MAAWFMPAIPVMAVVIVPSVVGILVPVVPLHLVRQSLW
jgi:hypothetical protein